MAKYRVTIQQTVYQSATLEIEAADVIDATEQARKRYTNGPEIQWRFDDCEEPDFDAELA
jgi:hypothetical protein